MNDEIAAVVKYIRKVAGLWREDAERLDEVGRAALVGRANGAEWAADEIERQADRIAESIALVAKAEAVAAMMRALRRGAA